MAENTTPALCSEEEFRMAREAGLLIVTTGEEAALHKFAESIRTDCIRTEAANLRKELRGECGWFLPRDAVNDIQAATINRLIARAKRAHMTDVRFAGEGQHVDMRINGQNEYYEADWIKHLRAVLGS